MDLFQKSFLFLFFCLLKHTNPTIFVDAKQQTLTLLLFGVSGPCIFDNHCTTYQAHHHQSIQCHHTICLFAFVLQAIR